MTPLVLVFEPDARVRLLPSPRDGAPFDLSSAQDGSATDTDWPAASNPWLAMDRDGDGEITSGRELFGSATRVGSGTAAHGFAALAALDDDGNGRIDAGDPRFDDLLAWLDRDADRRSDPGELRPIGQLGVVSISLAYEHEPRCDRRGNCERERARMRWRGPGGAIREGAVVDVHLRSSPEPTPAATARAGQTAAPERPGGR